MRSSRRQADGRFWGHCGEFQLVCLFCWARRFICRQLTALLVRAQVRNETTGEFSARHAPEGSPGYSGQQRDSSSARLLVGYILYSSWRMEVDSAKRNEEGACWRMDSWHRSLNFPRTLAGTHTALVRIEHLPGLPTPHGGAST
jgi:hypothetical protein